MTSIQTCDDVAKRLRSFQITVALIWTAFLVVMAWQGWAMMHTARAVNHHFWVEVGLVIVLFVLSYSVPVIVYERTRRRVSTADWKPGVMTRIMCDFKRDESVPKEDCRKALVVCCWTSVIRFGFLLCVGAYATGLSEYEGGWIATLLSGVVIAATAMFYFPTMGRIRKFDES